MASKHVILLCISLLLIGGLWVYWRNQTSPPQLPPSPSGQERASSGQRLINDFYQAKKKLPQVYLGMESTFYCGCRYRGKLVDHHSCGYTPLDDTPRAYRLEWEHVVPASDFGRSFREWREGHSRCISARGKKFKGRKCARLVSAEFKRMEADLYNLVPEIGEVNAKRSSLPMGLLPANIKSTFGLCATKITATVVEPRTSIRGFIARTYKYMHHNYPGRGIISHKNQKLFDVWEDLYPPSKEEWQRAQRIARIQGNTNIFIRPPAERALTPRQKVRRLQAGSS